MCDWNKFEKILSRLSEILCFSEWEKVQLQNKEFTFDDKSLNMSMLYFVNIKIEETIISIIIINIYLLRLSLKPECIIFIACNIINSDIV